MSFIVVIAHYNEDLQWSKNLPSENIVLYTKGKIPDVTYKIHSLPNIGLESHTYLTYIIDNYETLPDIVFFQQGSDDHIKADKLMECIHTLSISPDIMYVTNYLKNVNINNMYLDNEYHIKSWNGRNLDICEDNFVEWFKKNIDTTYNFNKPLAVNFGACFAVRKEAIHSRPKVYYETLIKQFGTQFPEVGHFIERSWVHLFNAQYNVLCI